MLRDTSCIKLPLNPRVNKDMISYMFKRTFNYLESCGGDIKIDIHSC